MNLDVVPYPTRQDNGRDAIEDVGDALNDPPIGDYPIDDEAKDSRSNGTIDNQVHDEEEEALVLQE